MSTVFIVTLSLLSLAGCLRSQVARDAGEQISVGQPHGHRRLV